MMLMVIAQHQSYREGANQAEQLDQGDARWKSRSNASAADAISVAMTWNSTVATMSRRNRGTP